MISQLIIPYFKKCTLLILLSMGIAEQLPGASLCKSHACWSLSNEFISAQMSLNEIRI